MKEDTKEGVWMAVWSMVLASIALVMIQKASMKEMIPTFRYHVPLLEKKGGF
jgi:hypothetical protein